MTRLARLSARAYGRLSPTKQQAVDELEWGSPPPARRAELKTLLGWRRTREETVAWARELEAAGVIEAGIANGLKVGRRYLRRLLEAENGPRDPFAHAGRGGTNRQRQGDRPS